MAMSVLTGNVGGSSPTVHNGRTCPNGLVLPCSLGLRFACSATGGAQLQPPKPPLRAIIAELGALKLIHWISFCPCGTTSPLPLREAPKNPSRNRPWAVAMQGFSRDMSLEQGIGGSAPEMIRSFGKYTFYGSLGLRREAPYEFLQQIEPFEHSVRLHARRGVYGIQDIRGVRRDAGAFVRPRAVCSKSRRPRRRYTRRR